MLVRAIRRSIGLVGDAPWVAAGAAAGFLAGDAQRAQLVVVVDVPHPGDMRAPADDLRRQIAAHAIVRGAFARRDREVARLRLGGEIVDQPVEHADRRAVDRTRTRWSGRRPCRSCSAALDVVRRSCSRQRERRATATHSATERAQTRGFAPISPPVHHPVARRGRSSCRFPVACRSDLGSAKPASRSSGLISSVQSH